MNPTMNLVLIVSVGPRQVETRPLCVPEGSTVKQALAHVAFTIPANASVAVWGRQRPLDWVLVEGDRLACLRPLTVDPMEARRRRHAHQKAAKAKRPRLAP